MIRRTRTVNLYREGRGLTFYPTSAKGGPALMILTAKRFEIAGDGITLEKVKGSFTPGELASAARLKMFRLRVFYEESPNS